MKYIIIIALILIAIPFILIEIELENRKKTIEQLREKIRNISDTLEN